MPVRTLSSVTAPCHDGPRERRQRLRNASAETFLLDLQPEILDAIASHLAVNDLSSLAITCRKAAAPFHSAVISARVAELRSLTCTAHVKLLVSINRLPQCVARDNITAVVQNAMCTFRRVCACNEDFVRLSRAVALRGLADPFNNSPLDAARLARSCCQTCDHVSGALHQVGVWLDELHELVQSSTRRGDNVVLLMGTELEQQQQLMAIMAEEEESHPEHPLDLEPVGSDDGGVDDVSDHRHEQPLHGEVSSEC